MQFKKIFLITPTLQQGGAERVISELANQFCGYDGVEIHLVLLAKSDDFYSIDSRVTIHRLSFENKGKIEKKISEYKTLTQLRKLYKRYRPVSALSFQERFNSFAILASLGTGIPVFVSDRSNPLKQLSPFNEKLRSMTYKYAAGIIAQTSFAKGVIEKKIKNKNIVVIPNPIKKIKTYPEIDRQNIILNIGRLVPEKGQKYLIEAFSKLKNKDWKLVILGEGELRADLEKQILELNIQDRVEMPGATEDVDFWLAKASIFVFPSISEGFPNALVEAMASGLPCVSFDCNAGYRYLIENYKTGILVEEKNIGELASALQELIDDPNLRLQLAEQAIKIREELSLDKIAKEYFEFMNN